MLHKINLAEGYDKLEKVLQFQQKLLAFVCAATTALPFDEATIRAAFVEEGEWLWKKINRADSKLKKLLEDVVNHCKANPGIGGQITTAFANDIDFHNNIDDLNFRFAYLQLSEKTRAVLAKLMIYFYKSLFEDGFPDWIDPNNEKYSRKTFVKAFKKANPHLGVCAACDGQSPSEIDDRPLHDTDHFLPKSKYPFYSVHPYNLVPICLECNRDIKGDTDPIDDPQDDPLLNIFYPYFRPAIENINVLVKERAMGELTVCIEDKVSHPSRRVQNLDNILRLESRWHGWLKDVVKKRIVSQILDDRNLLKREHLARDEQKLKASLEDHLKGRKEDIGKQAMYVLEGSYLNYALSPSGKDEFEELLISFKT